MKIPQITFGEDFEERTDQEKITYLKALASSMNHAADLMQKERNELAKELVKQKGLVVNAENSLSIQKQVVINQLLAGNQEVQKLSQQILGLQKQLKDANQTIEDLRR